MKEFEVNRMNDGVLDVVGDEQKQRVSISLDPDLFEKGRERARKARRNFSNYIEVLIEADVTQIRIPVVHSESVIPVPANRIKGDPIPTRFDEAEDKLIREISAQTGLSMAEIIRRAVRYACPKFLSGEINILDVRPGVDASYGGPVAQDEAVSSCQDEAGIDAGRNDPEYTGIKIDLARREQDEETDDETVRVCVSMPKSVFEELDEKCRSSWPKKSRSRRIQELIISDLEPTGVTK